MFLQNQPNQAESGENVALGADKRSDVRMQTIYMVAKVVRDSDVGLWRVANISNAGLKFRTGQKVDLGERLTIFLSDTIVVHGEVIWAGSDGCGVQFANEINCEAVLRFLTEERSDESYRQPRLPIGRRGLIYTESGIHAVKVENVSHHGVNLTHDGCLHPKMKFRIVLEGGARRCGIVKWSAEGRAGALLLEPFKCSELESARLL